MAAKGILKNIDIKDRKMGGVLVSTLEDANNKRGKKIALFHCQARNKRNSDTASAIQKGKYKMDIFERIKKDIMKDPMNASYTNRGIEPLYNVSERARIVVVGQAPGRVAEETGLYWNDLSGDRLRDWMGVSREIFYESNLIAQIPMDFYFPGKAKSGDAPPRKGFAEKWHPLLLKEMPEVKTKMLVGAYAQKHYLGKKGERNLTETVKNFKKYLPEYFPLIHPSPLNFRWMKKNPWFEEEVIPVLKQLIKETLDI